MAWEKRGLIFSPNNNCTQMLTHAQIPTIYQTDAKTLRIYFGTRDKLSRTRTHYLDVDIDNPTKIKYISRKPILDIGRIGTHDDSGAMPFCVVKNKGILFFYYTGWNQPKTVPYSLSIGLAISKDNGKSFTKFSEGPILSKGPFEPYWPAAPCVLIDNGVWRMWYISCTAWKRVLGRLEPVYLVKYAESEDGINWSNNNTVCIQYAYDGEAIGRPWVIKENGIFRMWYSKRGSIDYRKEAGQHYTIGYAESKDGLNWTRKDKMAGINISPEGWDSEMIEYCSVTNHKDRKYMFYNGNGFGKSGFGYAELR